MTFDRDSLRLCGRNTECALGSQKSEFLSVNTGGGPTPDALHTARVEYVYGLLISAQSAAATRYHWDELLRLIHARPADAVARMEQERMGRVFG